jgi:oxygen-independent coproporphyrinogen-3 oxidase
MDYENIYVHIPFCKRKCDYCSFCSEANPSSERIKQFLDKMETKLAALEQTKPAKTLFLGGGTPSLLSAKELQRLFVMIKKYLPLTEDAEISMECNPENLTRERLEVIKPSVNRISIGVQSFGDEFLDTLGRSGSQKYIEKALSLTKDYHFDNLSVDLIYGIPGQTQEKWMTDLKIATDYDIKHISCYALTVEEGTTLATRLDNLAPTGDDETAEMWIKTGNFLEERGISRYEVSNYSCPSAECKHNLNIWHGQTYLGLGPSAASFDGTSRWTEPKSLDDWLMNKKIKKDIIEPEYRLIEIFIIGLRTVKGWNRERWEAIPLQKIINVEWQTMVQKALNVQRTYPNLLNVSPKTICLTDRGLLFWNTIAEAWLE